MVLARACRPLTELVDRFRRAGDFTMRALALIQRRDGPGIFRLAWYAAQREQARQQGSPAGWGTVLSQLYGRDNDYPSVCRWPFIVLIYLPVAHMAGRHARNWRRCSTTVAKQVRSCYDDEYRGRMTPRAAEIPTRTTTGGRTN